MSFNFQKQYDGDEIGTGTYKFVKLQDTEPVSTTIIGFTGLTNSTGVLTWTDDIAGLSGYTTSTSGNLVTVSNASLDNRFPYNQITEMTDSSGNVLVKYPQMYMSWVLDGSGNIDGVKFANYQPDSTYFISDAFMQYGDTTYSKFNDYFALGKYEASGVSTRAYSASGQICLVYITRAQARTACMANGSTYQQLDLAQFTLYNFLCMLYYRTSNIQNVYAGATGLSRDSVTGTCDGITGLNGWNTDSTCVKMLGIENPYGNVFKWCDGVVFSSATIYAQRLPLYYSDTTSAIGSSSIGFSRPTTSNYVQYIKKGTSTTTQSYVYCSAVQATATEYEGDYCIYSSSGVVLYVGGRWNVGIRAGLWLLGGNYGASKTYGDVGCRLSYRPN